MRRSHQVPPLREEPVGAATAVLEPGLPARHGEGHVGVAGGHTEFPEEPHEVWIRAVVVDQEAGVERHGAGRGLDQHRVGVAAKTTFLFEQVHPVPAAQQIRRGQTRDACPDDGDVLHAVRRNTSTVGAYVNYLSMTNT